MLIFLLSASIKQKMLFTAATRKAMERWKLMRICRCRTKILALTGTMEVQPDDFEVVSALLNLNLNGVDKKEFFAHCFAMSLLIELELTLTDPFTMVSETDKRLFQIYFRHILENRCVTC